MRVYDYVELLAAAQAVPRIAAQSGGLAFVAVDSASFPFRAFGAESSLMSACI